VITGLLAIIIIWKYDVTEEKSHEIREALIARRGKVQLQGESVEKEAVLEY